MWGKQDTIREREKRDGEKRWKGHVNVAGCDTHVTLGDMLPALLPSLSHASVTHKGLHFPEGRWAATSLEVVKEGRLVASTLHHL